MNLKLLRMKESESKRYESLFVNDSCSLYHSYHVAKDTEGERNNIRVVTLLLNLTIFIICSSSWKKTHL